MLKMIITDAVVSKGFDGKPAVRYYNGDNGFQSASFRIGKRVYDSRAEDNHRWINLSVKGFGEICERIKKMKLKEGSFINLVARYDEEPWEDKGTGDKRSAPVLILDEIEYCSSGGNSQKNGQNASGGNPTNGEASAAGAPRSGRAQPNVSQGHAYPPAPQDQPYPPAPQGQYYPPAPQGTPYPPTPQTPPPMPENFTGYENYGGPQNQLF